MRAAVTPVPYFGVCFDQELTRSKLLAVVLDEPDEIELQTWPSAMSKSQEAAIFLMKAKRCGPKEFTEMPWSINPVVQK